MHQLVRALASLRLTVVLLALAMVLVFVGTIAQTRFGVWQIVDAYFRSPVAWIDPSIFTGAPGPSTVRVPLPGGAALGLALFLNLTAAHATRFKASRRKIGILVIHAGLIALLAGEFVTGVLAREGHMRIDEGGFAGHLDDARQVELAVLDTSDPGFDRLIRIPSRMLREAAESDRPISEAGLPFELRIERWLPSAELWTLPESGLAEGNPATEGVGTQAFARPAATSRGVDGAGSDLPAAYVTVSRGGHDLGTWLLWAGLDRAQFITIEGAAYSFSLRPVRTYLPFRLHLLDFRHDVFLGTDVPRNFSSDVRIEDPERGVDRRVRIWMNNPLRYRGLAFYQASYKPDGSGTVLQVVNNPGWVLPYVACTLVGLGLAWHFSASLYRFLRKSRDTSGALATRDPGVQGRSSPVAGSGRLWMFPGVALSLLVAGAPLLRPEGDPTLAAFARLPVFAGGRVKPIDTAARNLLMAAGGRASVRTNHGTVSAARFLLDMVALPPDATHDLPVVRVDDPDLLSLLGRSPDQGGRLPLSAIEPHWAEVARQAARAAQTDQANRDTFQHAVLELHSRVNTILAHAQVHEPLLVPPLRQGESWRSFHQAFLDDAALRGPGAEAATADSSTAPARPLQPHPAVAYYTAMMSAYARDDAAAFERAVHAYDELLERDLPGARRRARVEAMFNRAEPFLACITLYVLATLTLLASFLLIQIGTPRGERAADAARRVASGLLWSTVALHALAIVGRMWLQERPPVTNLYSSAAFVGWAAALFGMVVERVLPFGLSALGSAVIGFCTLIVAHNLGNDGDTMQVMQAVLDSNFWLATHVVTITLGYAATFLAGALGTVWIIRAVLGRLLQHAPARAGGRLPKAVYGVACFALLLSFVGTVLGGIWADQSWGRFWGWDPKENGAALIVLHLSLVLHARWGGLIRERGIAVLAVAGNIVTAWSWFGTNMLGTGLHSYGFTDSAAAWLAIFVGSQATIMALGLCAIHRSQSDRGPPTA